jgi:hypothetical protein
MRTLARWGTLPVAITVLTTISALYCTLVVSDKVFDSVFGFDTNFGNGFVTIVHVGVILWEALTAAALITALVYWLGGDHRFGRRFSTLGWTMVLILFGGGFLTIEEEWFAMWRSSEWNGLEPAFHNITIAGIGLILANLPAHTAALDDRDATPEADR